jgi:MFS family permease
MNADRLPRAWLIVGVLWVVAALNYLDRIMITTMRDSLTQAVPMTDAQFGLLTSVFLWVYGLLSPFAGFLADRFNRSRLIVFSLLVWSLLTWLTGHARSFEELIVVRALMGLSEAAYLPAALALIADYHRGSTRSLATGIHMTGLSVGTGLAGIGGWVAERHGWAAAFDVFGLFGIAYAVGLLFVLRDRRGKVALSLRERSRGFAMAHRVCECPSAHLATMATVLPRKHRDSAKPSAVCSAIVRFFCCSPSGACWRWQAGR